MSSKELKGIIVSIGGDSSGLGKAIKNAADMSKQLQTELNQINRNLKFDPSNATLLAQKEEVLTEKIKETKKELELLESVQDDMKKKVELGDLGADKYRAYQREVETTRGVLGNMEKQLDDMKGAQEQAENAMNGVNFSQAETKVDGLKQSYKSFADETKEHLDSVKEKAETIGSGIETVGKVVSVGSAAAAGALGSGVKFAMDFEDAMAKVSTIAKEDEKPIDVLRQEIIDLSNDTGIEATKIAENVYNAISAGQSTADAIDFVKNSTVLAKAGFTDASASLDVLTTIMNAYGMKAEEVGNVSDMLIQTQNLGKVTVGQLAESMGNVIPTANSYGVKLDQIAAAYSITTANGINAAESTTYINSMLTELGKSGTKASDILKKETGKSFKELMDDGNSLGDVLQIIKDSAEKNGTAFTDVWSKTNAAKGAITLLSDSSKVFNSRLSEMNDSTGATETAMGKLKTTSSQTKKIVNELKNAGIDLGDEVLKQAAPILKDIMGGVKNLTEWLKKLDPKQKAILTTAIEIMAVAGPGIIAIGKVTKGISNIAGLGAKLISMFSRTAAATETATVAQEGLNVAQNSNPIGLVITALGLLVGALGAYYWATKDAKDEEYELTDAQKDAIDKVDELKDHYNAFVEEKNQKISDNSAEFKYYDDLWNELQNIVDENGKVVEGYEDRAKFITEQLSKVTDNEIEWNGDIIKSYQDLREEIDKTIQLKLAETQLAGLESSYIEAITNQNQTENEAIAAYNDYYESLKRKQNIEHNKSVLEAEYKKKQNYADSKSGDDPTRLNAVREANEALNAVKEIDKLLQSAKTDVRTAEEKYYTLSATASEYGRTISKYEGLSAAIISRDTDKISSSLKDLEDNFITASDGTEATLKMQKNKYEKNYKELQKAVENGVEGVSQDQLRAAKTWWNNSISEYNKYIKANGTVKDGILSSLAKSDSESLERRYKAAVSNAIYLASAFANNVPGITKSVVENAKETADELGQEFYGAGYELSGNVKDFNNQYNEILKGADETISGVNDKSTELESSTRKSAINARGAAIINGWDNVGANYIGGLIGGIFGRQGAVHNAGKSAGYEAESGANSVSLFNVGDNFVGGFINGMLGGSAFKTLAQKAVNVASTAFNAIKNWLGIHSPSKETEKLGEYFSDGFAIGISKNSKKALAEASRLAKDTSGALTPERLANAADSLSGFKNSFQSAGLWSSQSVTNTTNSPTFNMTVNVNSLDSNTDINAAADKLMRIFGQKIQSDQRKWG